MKNPDASTHLRELALTAREAQVGTPEWEAAVDGLRAAGSAGLQALVVLTAGPHGEGLPLLRGADAVYGAIAAMGATAVPALWDLATAGCEQQRFCAVSALIRLEQAGALPREDVDHLLSWMAASDPDPGLRAAAARFFPSELNDGSGVLLAGVDAPHDEVPMGVRGELDVGNVFLQLGSNSFQYNREQFLYEDVIHLVRYAKRTSVNYVPVWRELRVELFLRGRDEPLRLAHYASSLSRTGKLPEVCDFLQRRTFAPRLAGYVTQLEEYGSFDYDGVQFFPSGVAYHGRRRLRLDDCVVSYEPFEMQFRRKDERFGSRLVLDTTVDEDVFFTLLHELYGIAVT